MMGAHYLAGIVQKASAGFRKGLCLIKTNKQAETNKKHNTRNKQKRIVGKAQEVKLWSFRSIYIYICTQ